MHKTELCSSSDKVLIQVISQLYIPTAFTPNSDGLNDYWKIPGLELYPDAEVAIYNRWGQLIQRSKNYNLTPWDGRFNGVTQPVGLYSYMIILNNSRKEVLKGAFTLLR
jgi:gliding motility-associated-like protein